jgi:hypothetical protein
VEFWASLMQKPAQSAPVRPVREAERPAMTAEEIAEWEKEFGDLDSDAGFKELFGPDFEEQ